MHTGYTLIQPYVFLTLNSLLTNEHLLSSPADLFCYEFSGDVSLKFVASPYTELIIGQRPDGSCRIFCIRTADEPLILKLSGFSYCFGVRFDDSLYYRLPGHPFPFPADLLQTISMLIIDGLVVAGVYVALYMVPQVSMLLLLFGFPLIAFINSYFFTEIFKKYIPKEEDQEHSNGISPLLDENNQEIEDAIQSLKGK